MHAASVTNTAINMLIVLAAAAMATATEALRGPQGLNQSLDVDGLAGNADDADDGGESALFDDAKHFLSEDELRQYLDEAVSGRQPPPASHPIRSVHLQHFMSRVETTDGLLLLVLDDRSHTSLKSVFSPFPFSIRPRRSAGDPVYIYLTPLEESSGPWDEFWTPSPSGCSRRCGGGVLAETRDVRLPTEMTGICLCQVQTDGIHRNSASLSGAAKTPTRRRARARPRGTRPAICSRARGVIRTRIRGKRSALGGRNHVQSLPDGWT